MIDNSKTSSEENEQLQFSNIEHVARNKSNPELQLSLRSKTQSEARVYTKNIRGLLVVLLLAFIANFVTHSCLIFFTTDSSDDVELNSNINVYADSDQNINLAASNKQEHGIDLNTDSINNDFNQTSSEPKMSEFEGDFSDSLVEKSPKNLAANMSQEIFSEIVQKPTILTYLKQKTPELIYLLIFVVNGFVWCLVEQNSTNLLFQINYHFCSFLLILSPFCIISAQIGIKTDFGASKFELAI